MIRQGFAILVALTGIIAAAAAEPQPVTLAGQIANIPEKGSKTFVLNEFDIAENSGRWVVELDSLGRFYKRFPINYPHTFTINYARRFITAFAAPGDSIYLDIDASKSPYEYHISGTRGDLNEEYSHANDALSKYYSDINLPSDTISFEEYMPQFRAEVERIGAIVDEYFAANSLSPETAHLLRTDNLYNLANNAYGYRGKGRDDQWHFFTDSLFAITDSANTLNSMFQYHISALCNRFPEIIAQTPKGLIRDIMYATDNDTIPPLRADFANPAYYDRVFGGVKAEPLEAALIHPSDIVVAEGDSVFIITGENPVNWLMSRYKGHPVYLDISATWCGPCRAALAASEDVRDHFKDSRVKFAILWLRSGLDTWTELIPTIHNAVHIFVGDEDTSNTIMGHLHMHGFPSYYILLPDGTISRENVPDYHSPDLPDFLNSLQ